MPGNRGMFISAIIFIVLCIIWGSSFILIKEGIAYLSPYQVATIRILSAGLVLLPVAVSQWKNVPQHKLGYVFLSGLLGSFFPAYLFCIAETKIDSSLAGFLNSLTPVVTIFTGLLFFGQVFQMHKLVGVFIAMGGMLVLLFAKGSISLQYLSYASFALVATLLYGLNINLVGRHLKETPSLAVVAVRTAVATILFYIMIKRAGGLLASMVTYGIPFIAMSWGLLAGETINSWQIVGLVVILIGVYVTTKWKQKQEVRNTK
jgi:drug/metabolite transporter (DMT)-like permease